MKRVLVSRTSNRILGTIGEAAWYGEYCVGDIVSFNMNGHPLTSIIVKDPEESNQYTLFGFSGHSLDSETFTNIRVEVLAEDIKKEHLALYRLQMLTIKNVEVGEPDEEMEGEEMEKIKKVVELVSCSWENDEENLRGQIGEQVPGLHLSTHIHTPVCVGDIIHFTTKDGSGRTHQTVGAVVKAHTADKTYYTIAEAEHINLHKENIDVITKIIGHEHIQPLYWEEVYRFKLRTKEVRQVTQAELKKLLGYEVEIIKEEDE